MNKLRVSTEDGMNKFSWPGYQISAFCKSTHLITPFVKVCYLSNAQGK